jgi:putative membrane protein
MMWQYGFHNGGFGLMGAFCLVFWAVVISLFIMGVMRMRRHGCMMHSEHHDNNALNIAKERYAKGDIDEKEFEKLKKALS